MSTYSEYTDELPRRHRSHRSRRDRDPVEYREREQTQLIRRTRTDDDDVEEIPREFSPGERYVERSTRVRERARSVDRGRYGHDDRYYADGRRPDGGYGRRRRHDDRLRRSGRHEYYSSESEYDSPSPRPKPRRRKSVLEKGAEALGIGGLVGAVAGHRSRSRSRDRYRSRSRGGRYRSYSYDSRSRSRNRDNDKLIQAGKAALTAAAVEAFRARNEPGGWTGEKGKRILTAAIGAGGVDTLVDNHPEKHGKRHLIESVVGGLAANRLVNGPRESRSRSRHGGRSRSRSRSKGGLKDLAAGGVIAAAGKQFLDRARSKSRGRRRSPSYDSYDSYTSSPDRRRHHRSRSRSVINKGLAALGLKDKEDSSPDRKSRRHRSRSVHYENDGYSGSRNRGYPQDVGRPVSMDGASSPTFERQRRNSSSSSSSSSDDIDSSEEERTKKRMHRKEYLTAGLATVATIHAAHNVYSSMEARDRRMQKVREGKMSPAEARKLRSRALLQDAASVGLAALGIKGAYSEWKEMNEKRKEFNEFNKKCEEHRQKRLEKARTRSRKRSQSANGYRYHHDDNYYDYDNYGRSDPNLSGGPSYYTDANPYASGALAPI
ncbi:MAG: hypothetical protein M1834_001830 [Cirrosporium novae-zelandiae]|nr:MAG: hypothetical protein M1834_001830 [Cirrosporium novae-zelandiae]